MRILMISDHADPLATIGSKDAGGQNIFVRYLAQHLSQLGLSVDVYTRWDRSNKKEIVTINNNLRIIRVKAGPKKHIPRDGFLMVVPEFTTSVLRFIRKEKLNYDVIHSNHWGSGLVGIEVAKLLNIPHFHVYHAIGQVRYEVLKEFKDLKNDYMFFQQRNEAEKRIAHEVTAVIATSPVEKEWIHKLFGVSSNKVINLTEGVDTKLFKPIDTHQARKKLKMPNKKSVLYVGRLQRRKGVDTLLYAFSEVVKNHPDTQLYIVGGSKGKNAPQVDKDERKRLDAIIADLRITKNIAFLGPKEQKMLPLYYSAADVCVVPSYYEQFGIVPLEAMACGTPVVCSKTGGLQYTVQDAVTGHHAKPRDPQDFQLNIEKVLTKGKAHYSKQCTQRIEAHFAWKSIAQQYSHYFDAVTKKLVPYFATTIREKV
jgi:D-inositol-3-phosphate glycosyltransferase